MSKNSVGYLVNEMKVCILACKLLFNTCQVMPIILKVYFLYNFTHVKYLCLGYVWYESENWDENFMNNFIHKPKP